jgi:hypothetical protein|nr:MAG TPA: hypothetical protein [Caudoviricetes sp.]
MSQELNQVKINKISKALYDENVANGTITPTMQEQEVWIFTDDEVYTSAEKTKLNGIEAGAQVNPTKLSELSNDVNFITNSVNNLTNYYTKTNTYTKTEVNDLINGITSMNVAVVQTLPTSGISATTIYLVPKSTSQTNNAYDEYLYVNNKWEKIGDTTIDLSNYALKSEIPTVTNDLTDTLKAHYDSAYEHSQLAHAPSNAQANVLEKVKVNGVQQTISNKEVNITVPTAKTVIW